MRRTVLVAGGAGFLGSHLCDRLLAQGHRVVSLDNFHTGCRHNHAAHLRSPDFRLLEADVAVPANLPAGWRVDRIYNLASPASPVHYGASPVYTMRTGLLGAISLLELAVRTGARLLQASTSEVYGDPLVHPQPETYLGNVNCFGERSCYDEAKRAAEALMYAYARERGVEVRIARIFNTYGPRMRPDDGRVVSSFIVQALRGEPLTIHGDGSQTRSFCHVDDLVQGLLLLMESGVATPVNLGNPEEFTVAGLAGLVLAATGSRAPCIRLPLPPDDPRQRRPDISLARRELGWSPTISLAEGLPRTVAHFRDRLAGGQG